ncbi:MAG: hypothetical protein AAGH40_03905 [Verrucomicrobiota bacterium]
MFEPVPLPSELDVQLKAHFERTVAHFEKLGSKAPHAIVLGGGYGRGEGGIASRPDGSLCFFNDLDYFIFTDAPEAPEMIHALHDWEREESALMGIDVEGKYLPKSDLKQTAGSMMFYDLVAAQTIVSGPKDFFEAYKGMAKAETIMPIEATRLLWNRGSGLLFARADLQNEGDLGVVHRNQAKAKLALGDALLTVRGQYRPYVRERQVILKGQKDIDPRIAELHEVGVSFKLRPTAPPPVEVLQATQVELTDLWRRCFLEVESARLGTSFNSPQAYASYSGKLFTDSSSGKNLLLSVRDRLKRGGCLHPVHDYPRGALQRALVLLLEAAPDYTEVSRLFGESITDLSGAVSSYTKWWQFYS